MGFTYPSNKICPRCGTGGYVWYLDNSEYVAKCTNCDHYFRREDFQMCVLDEAPKHMTNADRIRSMREEELAEFLTSIRSELICRFAENEECIDPDKPCELCWIEWLKKEVSE